ncbi:uncharacterized protein LOC130443538 isoform X1 [Diorhabda sublineata]|uniref:uncharacterized protein LOC130443538 isoform X1 n=1 Tax=Diorhabda sublineata TaxID=1163346 RepID=UPI0024E0FCAE|nr:uncharacterized protein LOC130443538 isoform X1 [Diorhabda sublineata]
MSNCEDNLSLYYSAVECYEEVEDLFYKEKVDYSKVKNGLKNCRLKIEQILLCENNNCTFLVDLLQLKNHVSDLITLLDNDKNISINKFNNNNINNKPYNKTNKENQDSQKLIESTIEAPRIKGLDEVAGLWEIKKILKSLIILPKNQPQLFSYKKTVNSILLFGPPGTGKTQLVHALSYEAGALLFSVTVSNILSPFVGQSEKNIKFLFNYIRNKDSFCLLFIDEVDGFCRKRSDSEQEFSRRIKTELLCQLNKMESYPNFFLIAATNCPWDLDPAFLRRFQKRLYIPLPNYTERRSLFKLFTNNTQLEEFFNSWEHLIAKTEGFSGSDICDLIQQAIMYPIMELDDIKIWKSCPDGFYEPLTCNDKFDIDEIVTCELKDLPRCSVRARKVQYIDLINALDSIKVTVTKEDIEKFDKFNNKI